MQYESPVAVLRTPALRESLAILEHHASLVSGPNGLQKPAQRPGWGYLTDTVRALQHALSVVKDYEFEEDLRISEEMVERRSESKE